MEIKQLELKDLIPYANNPRKKQAIDKVASSIKEFGWQQPIVVDEANVIIVGHTRYQAAQKLGLEKAPVQVAKGLTDAQVKAYRILDNRANQDALWDDELLKIEVQDLDKMDIDLALTGFDDKELDKLLYEEKEGLTDEDAVPEEVEPRVKQGELWQLGNHRLLCGDATKKENIDFLLDGDKADMVFTDPPYGVDYDGGIQFTKDGVKRGQRKKLENDDKSIYNLVIPILADTCEGGIYTWFAGTKAKDIYNSIDLVGDIHAIVIWVKNGGYSAMNAQYKQKHEPCLYWKAKNKTTKWCGSSTENTIWEINKDGKNKLHPTQKPVELAVKAILNHEEGIVLDVFLGSGSTLIACEKTNRKCYGMEIDSHYCDVIVKRWEEFSGKKAERVERAEC